MFNWLVELGRKLNIITVAADGLPTLAECRRLRTRWWHKWYMGKPDEPEIPYTHFDPAIKAPRPFDKVFDFIVAQKIVRKWTILHYGPWFRSSLHWDSLADDVGGMCIRWDGEFPDGHKELVILEIVFNNNHVKYWPSDDPHWWGILAHEMAHFGTKGHDADGFGVQLVRSKIFIEKQLEVAVAQKRIAGRTVLVGPNSSTSTGSEGSTYIVRRV